MRVQLGAVGHFGLAVRDPEASARWWTTHFDLDEMFRFEGGIAVSSDAITIALSKGTKRHRGTLRAMRKRVTEKDDTER
jgi:hypothetical protein